MTEAQPDEPGILILTDGKMGDLVQCRGVAALLTSPLLIREKVIAPGKFWSLPLMPVRPADRFGQPGSPLYEPFPDVVIASGRRTIPYLKAIRKRRYAPQKPLIVYLKNPRFGRNAVDFVWAPIHDGLSGANLITTHTSPHALDDEVMAGAKSSAETRFRGFGRPITGLVLGGISGPVKWDDKACKSFADRLHHMPTDGSILITPSRRTPATLLQSVRSALANHTTWVWDGSGNNPYAETLVHADRLIVTGDSHNMVSECLSLGKPVYVHRPPELQPKLHRFLDAMEGAGAIRNFTPDLPDYESIKIDATAEIAEAIRQRISSG